jgi:hypothetical protein
MAGYQEDDGDPATGAIPETVIYELQYVAEMQCTPEMTAAFVELRKHGALKVPKEHAQLIGGEIREHIYRAFPQFDCPEVAPVPVHLGPCTSEPEKKFAWVDHLLGTAGNPGNPKGPFTRPPNADVYTIYFSLLSKFLFVGVMMHGWSPDRVVPPMIALCRSRLKVP